MGQKDGNFFYQRQSHYLGLKNHTYPKEAFFDSPCICLKILIIQLVNISKERYKIIATDDTGQWPAYYGC